MIEAGADTKSLVAVLVPRFLVAGFGVKDSVTDDGEKWGGTKVGRAIEIFSFRDAGLEFCLTHEVESQISLGQELVPHVSG